MLKSLIVSLAILALVWAAPNDMVSGDLSKVTVPPVKDYVRETGAVCRAIDGRDGLCTPYYKCQDNDTVLADIDIDISDVCASYMDVCCKPEYIVEYP